MKYVYSILVLLLALFLAAFIQQNGLDIQLKYFNWSTPLLPLSLYLILSFAVGYALAVLVGFTSGIRFRLRASGAEKEVRQLKTELEQLKQEELRSVRSEFEAEAADSVERAPVIDKRGGTGDEPTKNLSGHQLSPDVQTVSIDPGEGDEK